MERSVAIGTSASRRALIDTQSEVARRRRRLEALDAERKNIGVDQQRLRENMKALRGSDEERQLLRRYTTQLNQQEDRLAELEREIASETAARDKAEQELARLIEALSFEFSATDPGVRR